MSQISTKIKVKNKYLIDIKEFSGLQFLETFMTNLYLMKNMKALMKTLQTVMLDHRKGETSGITYLLLMP